jgi:hypothetical protein
VHREIWNRLIHRANTKLTEFSPAERKHSSVVIEHQSVCFTKRYLLNPIMIELVDYFWGKYYVTTIIDAYFI